jgi:hypothetical protein
MHAGPVSATTRPAYPPTAGGARRGAPTNAGVNGRPSRRAAPIASSTAPAADGPEDEAAARSR